MAIVNVGDDVRRLILNDKDRSETPYVVSYNKHDFVAGHPRETKT